jgi:hypothetical protein
MASQTLVIFESPSGYQKAYRKTANPKAIAPKKRKIFQAGYCSGL